ncbi:MAG: ATP-binding protein, partial [Anaerolineae bacterium]|nr:ATP-binding protein [Anaerolineae bacterium]
AGLGRPLIHVHLADVAASDGSPQEALRLCLRDATLVQAVACVQGWDVLLNDDAAPPRRVCDALYAFRGPSIVVSDQPWHPTVGSERRAVRWVAFPVPAYGRRLQLWTHLVGPRSAESSLRLDALAGQFALTAGRIVDAVASAQNAAAQAGRPLCVDDLFAAARAYSNPGLAALARKIVPRYTWSDIILPPDQLTLLHEIVDTIRGRPLVLDEWGLGRKLASSSGVTVLFAGPPGTGKTMAAEVIADELGLDLFKIDLSTVVSKYIGETEKNLERIFEEAQTSNAILFFDEADAIFGKRSEVRDAHDRYANIEISYLLQRMEIYDGVAILATNLRANLDEAFTRRLQFSVHFPFPEEEYRERIWRTLFPPDVPRSADLDFGLLARRFRLSGGNIRNIIVSAAYLAAADGQQVALSHLLHGARRELQKMGRLVSEDDMALPADPRRSA